MQPLICYAAPTLGWQKVLNTPSPGVGVAASLGEDQEDGSARCEVITFSSLK